MRRFILAIWWLPAWFRIQWRFATGRLFIFRNESNEFLRYMLWWTDPYYEDVDETDNVDNSDGDEVVEEDDFDRMVNLLHQEVKMRKRRGDWG